MVDTPDRPLDSSVDLLVKAQAGDREALNRLLARYLPRLERWASGRLPAGARTMLDTGDLVQDAVIAAVRHLETLEIRHEGAIHAYLRQAVNNRLIDAYRRAARRPPQVDFPEHAASADASPLEGVIGAQAREQYEAALSVLSEHDRDAIVLRVELGCDYGEIAQRLDVPSVNAARMAVSRALARLAREMHRARHGSR
jgi:RNA polymerase sigma factor (sigma-70 family)